MRIVLTHEIGQENSEQQAVYQKHIFAATFIDDEFGQGDANREALFTIGMTILDVIVPDLLIRKRFEGLGYFHPVIVDGINGLIL